MPVKGFKLTMPGSLLIRISVLIASLVILYAITANILLNSNFLKRIINRRPERQQYQWDRAWTVLPGLVHVQNYRMSVTTRANTWNLHLDKAHFSIVPGSLINRTVRIGHIRASGASFDLKRHVMQNEAVASERRTEIAVYPVQNEAGVILNIPLTGAEIARERPRWRIKLSNTRINNVHDLTIDQVHWTGQGHVYGSLDMVTRDVLHIPHFDAVLSNGNITVQNQTVTDDGMIHLNLTLGPYTPRLNRGKKIFEYLSGNCLIEGNIAQSDILTTFFTGIDWIHVMAEGYAGVNITFDKGRLGDGSSFVFRSNRVLTEIKGWIFVGSGLITGLVSRADHDLLTRMQLELTNAGVQNTAHIESPLQVPNVFIDVSGKNISIMDNDPDVTVTVEIPDSRIENLSGFNVFFPDDTGFEILPDSHCALHAKMTLTRNSAEGSLYMSAENSGIRLRQQSFRGEFDFAAYLKTEEPELNVFKMTDTTLTLRNVRNYSTIQDSVSWSAGLSIPDAVLTFGKPISVSSDVEISLSHSDPLLALFASGEKQWFQDFIHVEDLSGRADLTIGESVMQMSDVSLTGTSVITPEYGIHPFVIHFNCSEIDLKKGISGLYLNFSIPPSEIPDLAVINEYLPPNSGLLVRPGSTGRVDASVNIVENAGHVDLNIHGRQTHFDMLGESFKGDPAFRIRLETRDVSSGVFNIGGSTVSLDNVDCLQKECEPSWWSRVTLASGRIAMGKPPAINGQLELTMRDTGPILAMFEDDSLAVRWLGDVLLIKNITGSALIRSDTNGIHVSDLLLQGDKLNLKAKLMMSQNRTHGIMYVRYRGFSLGIEMDNESRSYKLFQPNRWFDQYEWRY